MTNVIETIFPSLIYPRLEFYDSQNKYETEPDIEIINKRIDSFLDVAKYIIGNYDSVYFYFNPKFLKSYAIKMTQKDNDIYFEYERFKGDLTTNNVFHYGISDNRLYNACVNACIIADENSIKDPIYLMDTVMAFIDTVRFIMEIKSDFYRSILIGTGHPAHIDKNVIKVKIGVMDYITK